MNRKIEMLFLVMSVWSIGGCMPSKSNLLTHVPQSPIWQTQMPYQKVPPPVYISTYKVREKLLANQPSEIKRGFIEYQRTGKAPVIQSNDFVWLPYSESVQPIVVCEPLYTCDISLEPGEIITSLRGGDTVRWVYDEIYSGERELRQPHALVKPKFPDISTDMVITTNKRIYHIGLTSKMDSYIKQARFYYPLEMAQQLKLLHDSMLEELKQAQTIEPSVQTINPSVLDNNYRIDDVCCSANPPWKPLRAFNDGTHVFIEMPPQIRVTDAPVLFVSSKDGTKELVNYRVKKNYYVVDQLFKQATLVSGIGDAQEKVMITYTG